VNFGCADDAYMLSGSAKMGSIEQFVGDSLYLGTIHPLMASWTGLKKYESVTFTTGTSEQYYLLASTGPTTQSMMQDCLTRGYNFMSYSQPNTTWYQYKCGYSFSSAASGAIYGPDLDITYVTYNNDNEKVQCNVSSSVYPYSTSCVTNVTLGTDYVLGFKATKTILITSDTSSSGESSDSVFCAAGTSCSLSYGVTKEYSQTIDFGFSASTEVETLFWSGEVEISVSTAFSATQSISQSATIDVTPTSSTCYSVIDSQWTITNTYLTQLSAMGSVYHRTMKSDVSLSNLFVRSPNFAIVSSMTKVKNVRGLDAGTECGS